MPRAARIERRVLFTVETAIFRVLAAKIEFFSFDKFKDDGITLRLIY